MAEFTPPPVPQPDSRPAADPRSALFDAIKSGRQLKHVEVVEKKVDTRNELLEKIRQGVELKSVSVLDFKVSLSKKIFFRYNLWKSRLITSQQMVWREH